MMQPSRRDLFFLVALIAVTGTIFGVIYRYNILLHHSVDFNAHVAFARLLYDGQLYAIHALFHVLVILVQMIPIVDFDLAAWLITLGFYIITMTTLYAWMRSVTSAHLAFIGALVAIIVTPITVLTWSHPNLYIGYIGINIVHNPTMVLLKAFALPIFIAVLLTLDGRLRLNTRKLVIGMTLVIISMFAKPNFALVLVPALLVVMTYRYLSTRNLTGVRLITMGIILPMLIILPVQYWLQYALIPNTSGSQIILAPFATIYNYEPSLWWIAIKFVMSIAFPLIFTLLYRRNMRDDLSITLAWWMFIAGAAQHYLFAESGGRFIDGNFWWSSQIALWLLFAACLRLFIPLFKREPRAYLTSAILGLHLLSGVVLFVASLLAEREFNIW